MKPLLVTSGEPAGIGPDISLSLANSELPLVVIGDKILFTQRCKQLNLSIDIIDYKPNHSFHNKKNSLIMLDLPCSAPVTAGKLDVRNAPYVIDMLTMAVDACLRGEFSGLVTAPVHKSIINEAGIPFTGHTEFLANRCKTETVVMMLACDAMRVALVTTHLPLLSVPAAITKSLIIDVISQLNKSLQRDFGISSPRIFVAGLNPHAGEGGYLGREELEIINPAYFKTGKP